MFKNTYGFEQIRTFLPVVTLCNAQYRNPILELAFEMVYEITVVYQLLFLFWWIVSLCAIFKYFPLTCCPGLTDLLSFDAAPNALFNMQEGSFTIWLNDNNPKSHLITINWVNSRSHRIMRNIHSWKMWNFNPKHNDLL